MVHDGTASVQSVLHILIHILPRNYGDLDQNNNIYNRLGEWVPIADHLPSLQNLDVPEYDIIRYWKE